MLSRQFRSTGSLVRVLGAVRRYRGSCAMSSEHIYGDKANFQGLEESPFQFGKDVFEEVAMVGGLQLHFGFRSDTR